MRRALYISILLVMLLASCSSRGSTAVPERLLTLEDCVLTTPSRDQVEARCGAFTVPEDRSRPQGRQLHLYIAVIPAIKRKPEPDPLFLLAGGPGQSAIETFPAMIDLLSPIHEDRDIVLVDQRGTGKSNPLRCLDPENESVTDEQALEELKACPSHLDADVRFYTTEIAMADLDEVRAALGYERINLYGGSYGTRAALTYLRMFPDRVRTITLDAVVDPQFILYQQAAEDGQQALEAFFARCEADQACNSTFPRLRGEFNSLVSRLESAPATISMPHPRTNRPLELVVTRQLVADMIFNTLYIPDLVATLPLAIHEAYVDNNFVPLISQAFLVNAGLYDGMFYAVTCTEDAPLLDVTDRDSSIFGHRAADFAAVCSAWPRGQVSSNFREPIDSDIPALLLSGAADPITPPRHAEQVVDHLTNKMHLIFPAMGHGNLFTRCSIHIFNAFLNSASPTGLDTACGKGIEPPPFFVDFSGPRP